MADDHRRDLTPRDLGSLSVTSRFAARTLADRVARSDAPTASGRTLVVGPGGYPTISEAVASAMDDDMVLIRPGTYRESVTIKRAITLAGDGPCDEVLLVSDDGPCLIVDDSTARVMRLTIRGGGAVDEWGAKAAVLVRCGSPVLDGLVLAESYGIKTMARTSASIRNCVIRDGHRAGIWAGGSSAGDFEDNDIFGNALFGIIVCGTDSAPLVRANRIHDNDGGVWVSATAAPLIEDNDIYCNVRRGIWVERSAPLVRTNRIHGGQRYGIVFSGTATGLVEGNSIFDNADDGIVVSDSGAPVIRANQVHNNNGAGIRVQRGAAGTIENNRLAGNSGGPIAIEEGATPSLLGNLYQ